MLLDFGTEEQKLRHLPAILKGEELWMQFLSEPSGGSDVAGALTTAVRDGDEWVLNGSKVWTTGAWWSDWGLCLARTNWDVPKHRGLSVFMLPIHQPGIEVHRIEMLNGSKEFCQEFMTDVRVPDTDRIGEVDDGWTVGHPLDVPRADAAQLPVRDHPGRRRPAAASAPSSVLEVARDARSARRPAGPRPGRRGPDARGGRRPAPAAHRRGHRHRGHVRPVGGHRPAVRRRVSTRTQHASPSSSPAPTAAAWTDDDGAVADCGSDFLMRQVSCIGGGTTEMARNVISERVLGMPRERTLDRDVPFRDVPRSAST